jgi:hypothetical protein
MTPPAEQMDGHLIARQIVIVGGVFAGLFAAERRITIPLRDLFRRQDNVDRCWPRCPTSTSTPENASRN